MKTISVKYELLTVSSECYSLYQTTIWPILYEIRVITSFVLAINCKCEYTLNFGVLTPLSTIFQLYNGDQFQWWRKPEYPKRTTDPGKTTGKLFHLRLRVECTLFCNLQSWARTYAVLVIGLYELLNPTI
jgi:hypothetical protein